MKPSIELLRKWFLYNPQTGTITRLLKDNDRLEDIVPLDKRLYFRGKRYPYSHIAWALYYGVWPNNMIDHKNHKQLDFRINNLREANQNQNQHNKRSWSAHGKGVSYDISVPRNKPYVARISIYNKSIFLGTFETAKEAAEAYRQAALKYHGEFACLE